MSQNGKGLTNDEWHKLTKDSFDDFRVSHHPTVAPSSYYPPVAVHATITSKWHHSHLSALGGESSKPIQEVVTTQTALEGEPSTIKMVMMPITSIEYPIESTHLNEICDDSKSQEHEDKNHHHPAYITLASKSNINQLQIGSRALNRINVLDGSSNCEFNMTHCIKDAQDNSNHEKIDL